MVAVAGSPRLNIGSLSAGRCADMPSLRPIPSRSPRHALSFLSNPAAGGHTAALQPLRPPVALSLPPSSPGNSSCTRRAGRPAVKVGPASHPPPKPLFPMADSQFIVDFRTWGLHCRSPATQIARCSQFTSLSPWQLVLNSARWSAGYEERPSFLPTPKAPLPHGRLSVYCGFPHLGMTLPPCSHSDRPLLSIYPLSHPTRCLHLSSAICCLPPRRALVLGTEGVQAVRRQPVAGFARRVSLARSSAGVGVEMCCSINVLNVNVC